MKTSEILRLAKTHLRAPGEYCSHKVSFICYALYEVAVDERLRLSKGDRNRLHAVREEIARRIAPYGTVGGWLVANVDELVTGEQTQFYRHRWLDHLIAEYEAKGD